VLIVILIVLALMLACSVSNLLGNRRKPLQAPTRRWKRRAGT